MNLSSVPSGHRVLHLLIFILLSAQFAAPLPTQAVVLPPGLFQEGGYMVKRGGEVLVAHNSEKSLIPASTWKIATALAALDGMGADYRFPTAFHLADNMLVVQGFGDPLLTSEEVELIAERLAGMNPPPLEGLILDDHYFHPEQNIPAGSSSSLRTYDAANGALAVNFNTVNVEVDQRGRVRSAEPQTPTLPVMQTLAGELSPGIHRLNFSQDRERVGRYVGELFLHRLQAHGIKIDDRISWGRVPLGARLLYLHHSSRNLEEIVRQLLLYSNNFVANQLFLTAGAQKFGPPADWEKGRRYFIDFLLELGINPKNFQVEEGSGLSRKNRITPAALIKVLERFEPHAGLLPRWHGRLIKSGTLTGVYAYAGFFTRNQEVDPFVLILNQRTNTRDRAIELLEERWLEP